MKKLLKALVAGIALLFITSTANAFEQPIRFFDDGVKLNYKNEIYQFKLHQVVSIPFETKDFSLAELDHFYLYDYDSSGDIIKGIMAISIHKGPTFAYAVYDVVKGEGFGLIDTDCDGEMDLKTEYDSAVIIPDCLYELRAHELN